MAKVFSSKRDVYIEIADRYEKYITLGVIKSGEKLPSVRVTAGELGVTPNTVQRAYSLLEERGFKGSFTIKAVDDKFVTHASVDRLLHMLELDCEGIYNAVKKEFGKQ